jgi:hypothetical protein
MNRCSMTAKTSRAAKAAMRAFRGLTADEEEVVLKELGLVRAPAPEAATVDLATVVSETVADFESVICFDGSTGNEQCLPHPDMMTPEQRAMYHPPRQAAPSKLVEKLTKSGRVFRAR